MPGLFKAIDEEVLDGYQTTADVPEVEPGKHRTLDRQVHHFHIEGIAYLMEFES